MAVRIDTPQQFQRQFGAIAILDALGASYYSEQEIIQFLSSRDRVLADLNEWIEEEHGVVRIDPNDLEIFTFNDTIIIVLKSGMARITLDKSISFTALLRKFLVDSMAEGILFRGSAALGAFYVDSKTNTVMGEAVTDAAQWYEKSDWVGVHFTPRSFIELTRMVEVDDRSPRWAFTRWGVPLRDGGELDTYAVNWPKIFLLKARPWPDDLPPRSKLLKFLGRHRVPQGTEGKYFNTIKFFDSSIAMEMQTQKKTQKKARPRKSGK